VFACEFLLPSEETSPDLDEIRNLYKRGEIEEAEILLQKCIDRERLPSHDLMKQIMDESSDETVKDSILKMHFLNFV